MSPLLPIGSCRLQLERSKLPPGAQVELRLPVPTGVGLDTVVPVLPLRELLLW